MVDHAGVENVGVGVEEVGDLEVVKQVIDFVLGAAGNVEGGEGGGVAERMVDREESGAGL